MKYPISEIFGPTIQGEGPLIGTQCIFVRFAGCDSNCSWCDTLYAKRVTSDTYWKSDSEIQYEIDILSGSATIESPTDLTYTVVLTGGNPCLYDLEKLIKRIRVQPAHPWDINRKITLETQGTIYKDWVSLCDSIIVSPKTFDRRVLGEFCFHNQTCLKVVITSWDDLLFLNLLRREFPKVPIIVQPCNLPGDTRDSMFQKYLQVFEWVKHLPEVRVLPQLHRLLWLNQKGV